MKIKKVTVTFDTFVPRLNFLLWVWHDSMKQRQDFYVSCGYQKLLGYLESMRSAFFSDREAVVDVDFLIDNIMIQHGEYMLSKKITPSPPQPQAG